MEDSLEELVELIGSKGINRMALIIGSNEIDLKSTTKHNQIYILELALGNASGGRGGGFGQRTISRIRKFVQSDGNFIKKIENFH